MLLFKRQGEWAIAEAFRGPGFKLISARTRVFLRLALPGQGAFLHKDTESVHPEKLSQRATPMGKQSLVREKNKTSQMRSLFFKDAKKVKSTKHVVTLIGRLIVTCIWRTKSRRNSAMRCQRLCC